MHRETDYDLGYDSFMQQLSAFAAAIVRYQMNLRLR